MRKLRPPLKPEDLEENEAGVKWAGDGFGDTRAGPPKIKKNKNSKRERQKRIDVYPKVDEIPFIKKWCKENHKNISRAFVEGFYMLVKQMEK